MSQLRAIQNDFPARIESMGKKFSKIQDVADKYTLFSDNLSSLNSRKEAMKGTVENYRARLEDVMSKNIKEFSSGEMQSLYEEILDAYSTLDGLENEISSMSDDIEYYYSNAPDVEDLLGEAENAFAEMDDLESAISSFDTDYVDTLLDDIQAAYAAADECEITLDKSQTDLQAAIDNGDKETEEKLRNLQDMIDDTRVFVEKVDKEITSYEGKADLLKATGMFKDGAVEKLKTVLKDCSEFDLQRHIDRAGEELAWMSKIKLEELTKDRVEEVKHILELMNNLVDDATQMVDESQSKTEEMSSFVDDWSSRADEYYSSLDDYSTAILDGYDEVLGVYSQYEPEVDSWWSDLETAYNQMESDYSAMLSLVSELTDGSDTITDGYDALIHNFYDYFDRCIDIEDEAQASYEVLESWVDSYGDLIRRYM